MRALRERLRHSTTTMDRPAARGDDSEADAAVDDARSALAAAERAQETRATPHRDAGGSARRPRRGCRCARTASGGWLEEPTSAIERASHSLEHELDRWPTQTAPRRAANRPTWRWTSRRATRRSRDVEAHVVPPPRARVRTPTKSSPTAEHALDEIAASRAADATSCTTPSCATPSCPAVARPSASDSRPSGGSRSTSCCRDARAARAGRRGAARRGGCAARHSSKRSAP